MSYRGEQKIKGKTYVYEAIAVWNPEKKRSEQKRVYIGSRDPETGDFIPNKTYELLEKAEQEGSSRDDAVHAVLSSKKGRRSSKSKEAAPARQDEMRISEPTASPTTPVPQENTVSEPAVPQENTVSEPAAAQEALTRRENKGSEPSVLRLPPVEQAAPPRIASAAGYGRACALRQVAAGCGLSDILKRCFPSSWEKILEYAISGSGPVPPVDEGKAGEFFAEWTEHCSDQTYRSFYTGLSHFYPDSADVLAAGSQGRAPASAGSSGARNAAGAGIPQITVLVGAESGLPVYYRFDEGLVPVMQDLITGFGFLKPLDLTQVCFCFPEFLYTDRGLYLLLQHDIRFIVRMPLQAIPAASLLKNYDPEQPGDGTEVILNGRPCLIRSVSTVLNGRHVCWHLCCDRQSRRAAKANLLHHICSLEEKVTSGSLQTTDAAVRRYLAFERKAGEGWMYRRKEEVIREELKYAGCFILLSNGVDDTLPVLQSALFQTDLAKIADQPGKLSENLKSDPDLKGADPWNPKAVSTEVFCSFLKLILHTRIQNLLLSGDAADLLTAPEKGGNSGDHPEPAALYSPENLLAELEEIRQIRYEDGTAVITPLTDRQAHICRMLGVKIS